MKLCRRVAAYLRWMETGYRCPCDAGTHGLPTWCGEHRQWWNAPW